MRKTGRAALLTLVSIFAAITMAVASAFTAALAYGAVALIVPGTGTPDANKVANYRQNARDYYFQGTACSDAMNCPDDALHGINYPASFFPLIIFPSWCRSGPEGCDKWDESVGQGAYGGPLGPGLTSELDSALATPGTPGERDIVIFGYSQGGAVVSKVLNEYDWAPGEKERVEVVTIGGIENPDGGLWQRLAFLRYIPFLDITFAPPMPVDPAIKTTTIGFQYDPVVYAPKYWGNPFALLNAFAGFENVHGDYLEPNGNDGDTPGTLPYGYTPPGATGPNLNPLEEQLDCSAAGHPENCRYDSVGNVYIMIPATSLPIMNLILSSSPSFLQPIVAPLVRLVSPAYKVLADLGYDFSGDPGTPTPLSILPFNPLTTNPFTVGGQLVAAVAQGFQDAIGGGATTTPNVGSPDATPAARQAAPAASAASSSTASTLSAPSAAAAGSLGTASQRQAPTGTTQQIIATDPQDLGSTQLSAVKPNAEASNQVTPNKLDAGLKKTGDKLNAGVRALLGQKGAKNEPTQSGPTPNDTPQSDAAQSGQPGKGGVGSQAAA